jgi:hypothetical protein
MALREDLGEGEVVVAIGRCEDITDGRGGIHAGGAASTFVMVTDRALRWVPHAHLEFRSEVAFDAVTRATEHSEGHRYAVAVDHPPLAVRRVVPAHRFLMFQWGDAVRSVTLNRTELAFSRRGTKAAEALQRALASRDVPMGSIVTRPPPRREGSPLRQVRGYRRFRRRE